MTLPNDKVITLPFYHRDQQDRPNQDFPSSLALKQAFDSSTIAIQNALNAIIDDLISTSELSSGAEQIGSASISGVVGNTIYEQLVYLENQIQAIVSGSVAPGTITTAMLQDFAVTNQKLAPNSVSFDKLSNDQKTASVGGLLYAYRNIKGGF